MQLAISILSSILIIYTWIRLVDTIFSHRKIKWKVTIQTLVVGLLLVWWLYFYPQMLEQFNLWGKYFFENITKETLALFIGFCLWFVLVITVLFSNLFKKRIWKTILIWIILFAVIWYGWYHMGISMMIMYYIITAYAEEYMKYSASNNMMIMDKRKNPTDLIFFCVLIWLGFSMVENFFYIWHNIISWQDSNMMWLLVSRGLISTLLHVIASGLIAFIYTRHKKKLIPLIIGILAWFGIHGLYNISLYYNQWLIIIPLVVLWYFLLTYLMFQSDILYEKK